jgi:RHS repeat-associated protein
MWMFSYLLCRKNILVVGIFLMISYGAIGETSQVVIASDTLPEGVLVQRSGFDPSPAIERQLGLGTLSPGYQSAVFAAPPCLAGRYYAGFQLYYDLGDRSTVTDWSASVELLLLHGNDTVWHHDLQVSMSDQTFIATRFHDSLMSCQDDYRFFIRKRSLSGSVPQSNIYLKILLHRYAEEIFNPSASLQLNYSYSATGESLASWNYNGSGVLSYDLEWVFIDDTDNFNGTAAEAFTFKRPVRISTAALYYKHQNHYRKGKIWYRARAVGYSVAYPTHRIPGAWFYGSGQGLAVVNGEATRNWMSQVVYAEEGKYKHVVNYYDGSLRERQNVINVSTESLVLVGESLYDYEGRKSCSILSVPSTDVSLNYRTGFHLFESSDAVVLANTSSTREKFHYDNHRRSGSKLSDQYGAGKYYSPQNNSTGIHRNYIADGEGYVYSQTEYVRDGTDRISRQGGVGPSLKIDNSHALRYYYGDAGSSELIRLFGNNVGDASHYKKQVSVDANGQVTVSYLDQADHVIATSLAGDPVPGVTALSSYINLPVGSIQEDISSKNQKQDGVSTLRHTLVNAVPNTSYTIRYDQSSLGAQMGNLGCQSCQFDLRIVITDSEGTSVDLSGAVGNESSSIYSYERHNITSSDCQSATGAVVEFTVVLPEIGDYTISKQLTAHELSYSELENIILQDATVIDKITAIYSSYTVDSAACDICTACPAGDSAIDNAIQEIADRDCDNIYQQILQYYQEKYGTGDTVYEVPQDSIESHALYCQYAVCVQDKEGAVFEKHLARVQDWDAALTKGYNQLINHDPYFNNSSLSGSGYKAAMQGRLNSIYVATIGYDSNGDGVQDGSRVYQGNIDQITDPLNTTYYIDSRGNLSPTGRHILYLDLMDRRSRLSTAAYNAELSRQRWVLYKSYYQEAKRKTQLSIPAYRDCPAAQSNLSLTDELPQSPDSIATWGEANGSGGAVSPSELEMVVTNLSFNCDVKFSAADSIAIAGHLQSYFNSNRRNMFRLILRADIGVHASLIAIESILSGYSCSLQAVGQDDPISCAEEGGNVIVNPLLTAGNGCGADITPGCYPGWGVATGTPNTDIGGGTGRLFIWAYPESVTSEAARGSFTSPLEVGAKYELCLRYRVEQDGATYTAGTTDHVYFELSRSKSFINARGQEVVSTSQLLSRQSSDTLYTRSRSRSSGGSRMALANCILPGARYPDGVLLEGSNTPVTKVWEGHNLTHASQYRDTCIVFVPTQASTYFYLSMMSCTANTYQGINITDLALHKISGRDNTIEFEGESVCVNYDTSNPALDGFSFTVDWNQEVEECLANAAAENAQLIDYAVERLLEEEINRYYTEYKSQCLGGVSEKFTYAYEPKEYHYTLYYYDQSEQLVQTIPPSGVHPLTPLQVNAFLAGNRVNPVHNLHSRYQYNSLDQVIWQDSPDAHASRFWYNDKGQPRLSQNAQQHRENKYSYTRYDEQGRIVEAGEIVTTVSADSLSVALEALSFPSPLQYSCSDVVWTHYDLPYSKPVGDVVQINIRSRVSYIEVLEKGSADTVRSYYSYDIHGNVKTLWQALPGLGIKRTDYRYDLVSGHVTHMFYQYGKPDQFVHRYSYDGDNRLREVYTSTDRYIWNRDASYRYYDHGPEARTEYGEYRVQGQDYYYTLQGWIKGVNMPYSGDPGGDGMNTSHVGKDVAGYTLGYFKDDYKPVGGGVASPDLRDQVWTRLQSQYNHNGLYNGNISWMITDLAKVGAVRGNRAAGMQAMLYQYDQLHRLVTSRSLTSYIAGSGFASRSNQPGAYDEDISYDGNGNILTLLRRNGQGNVRDDLHYQYYANTNKLREVNPLVRDTIYQSGAIQTNHKIYRNITIEGSAYIAAGSQVKLQASENIYIHPDFRAPEDVDFYAHILDEDEGTYMYDATGNLVADQLAGMRIQWTPHGKIREVRTKVDSVVVSFRYDGLGNRIEKRVVRPDTTYVIRYSRDANGMVMAVYYDTLAAEYIVYAKERLGIYRGYTGKGIRQLGHRHYELTNHLGNVLSVITDQVGMTTDSVWATVYSTTDYYAFGLPMEERSIADSLYRYGFGGHEKDDEIAGNGNHLSFGDFGYDPRIARRWNVDPKFKEIAGISPYTYALNNPIVYIDEDGKLPILPLLLKAGAAGAADMLTQAAMAYFFDPSVKSASQAIDKVNWWQVSRSAAEGLIPWRVPGGRFGKAAATAVGDVLVNAISEGTNYSTEKALQDFAVGFIGDLAGGGFGELLSKYGSDAVARGLSKMGFDDKKIEELFTGAGTTWKGRVDYSDLDASDAYAHTRGAGKDFTASQKAKILDKNKKANNGHLRDDETGEFLDKPVKDRKGVPTNMKSAQVDHKQAKNNRTQRGTNKYSNAQVLSKERNMQKSNR